jgi:Leucine-rich repeat (LRR) protein
LELSPTREASLDFQLVELPKAIGRMTELRFLILDTNHLRTLPNEICHLRKLLVLVVSNNALIMLPDAIGNMQQIESIHLTNNRLRDLPTSLFHLKNLTFLDVSSNKLRQLSDGIAALTQLRSLLLYDNRLGFIPESIIMLKHLKTLWLGQNRLRSLPRSLTQLKQLDWKRNYLSTILDGNPLVSPPLAVCRSGFAAIEQWHQQIGPGGNIDLDDLLQQSNDVESSVGGDMSSRFHTRR